MKVGIVSPYFGTIGGGERYVLTVAKFFLNHGDRVDIFSGDAINSQIVLDFFGLNLKTANFLPNVFFQQGTHSLDRLMTSAKYDLMFFLSDGSIPFSLARKNWLHFQTPLQYANQKTISNRLKLALFENIICNSKFTARYIDRTYRVHSRVIYPPVDVKNIIPGEKENLILATGRFSDPTDSFQHAKKQETLIKAFSDLVKNGLRGWQLVLAGSGDNGASKFIAQLQFQAKNFPIEIVVNPDFDRLKKYYAIAKIFWHAAGYGENLEANPARAEHFGITTVEAMAAGAVPVVFSSGGQKEIVQQDSNGFLWETLGQLKVKTKLLIESDTLRQQMADRAIVRSKVFSNQRFFENLEGLLKTK